MLESPPPVIEPPPNQPDRITANSVLPARREAVEILTGDGLRLVGELASPASGAAGATLVCVHPLPTHGGSMDSHLFRKAAWRLPALAGIAVLRFNLRGTCSRDGCSEGSFDAGNAEGLDLAAAVEFVSAADLPVPWLVGWSFGTEVILRHPVDRATPGVVLISPPLRSTTDADLRAWQRRTERPLVLVPEFDDYLRPAAAAQRFAEVPRAEVVVGEGAGHLWLGERNVRFVLDQITAAAAPYALDPLTRSLPTSWDGPMRRWSDL